MKINYNKNPLYTTIELDEQEKKELWYKIKIAELEEHLLGAELYLSENPKWFDLNKAREEVNSAHLESENGQKSKLDKWCDQMLNYYTSELMASHAGDCTCFPCSCGKCHAEDLIGVHTTQGLGKHSAHKILNAFGQNNEKTIEEAIEYLANYEPTSSWEGWEAHAQRWKAEAKAAHDWLVDYKNKHFK